MKVFISWSGDLSQALAVALRDWLPSVLQSVKPFVSSEDIESGARWSNDIGRELEATTFGLLCVTRESLIAPWLNFEAGALSKWMDQSRVVPLLFRLRKSEIKGPLLQFNMRNFEKQDLRSVIETLNNSCTEDKLDQERLTEAFDVWWPRLETKIKTLPEPETSQRSELPSVEANTQILEELLDLVRAQQKVLATPEMLLPSGYLRHIIGSENLDISPKAIDELLEAWHFLFDLATSAKQGDTIATNTLIHVVADMERPLSYILDRIAPRSALRRPRLRGRYGLREALMREPESEQSEQKEHS